MVHSLNFQRGNKKIYYQLYSFGVCGTSISCTLKISSAFMLKPTMKQANREKKHRIITKWCFIWQTPVCGANKQKIFYCGLNSMKHENSVHDRCLCMGIFSPYSYAFNLCIVYGWIYKFCVFRLPHEFESPVQRNDNNNNNNN